MSDQWTFVEHDQTLVGDGKVVRLTPRAAALLACLLRRNGQLASHREILSEVWQGLGVSPDLVRECVFHLRAALGDDARAPRFIETVRGRGFRLLGGIGIDGTASGAPLPTLSPGLAGATAEFYATDTAYKTVTALHCAIDEATTPADRSGSEAAHERMKALFSCAQEVLERHEGTIVQHLDDGFLALFGVPFTHEDHARRAALTALELNALLNGEGVSTETPLLGWAHRASMGLSTGPIVVGTLPLARAGPSYTAKGLTVDLAKRLQAQAPAGSVFLSASTYRLLKSEIHVEVLPGIDGSPLVYALRGVQRARAGVQTGAIGKPLRLHGRKEELSILREHLIQARDLSPQVVSLTGPPGIGKSRLLEEFRGGLAPDSVRVLEGACVPHCRHTPTTPLRQVLRSLCGIRTEHDAVHAAKAIESHLAKARIDKDLLPPLLDVLALPTDDDWHKGLGPKARRARLFQALDTLILTAASERPVALIFEDIHWMDATSEEWLSMFVSGLGEAALFLLTTYRPPLSPGWAARVPATQLALSPLNVRDSDALVRTVLDRGRRDRNSTISRIVEKSQGNPFFLIELSSAANEHPESSIDELLPENVQAVLLSRIDRLNHLDRSIVRICSVIGDHIPFELLKAVCNIDEASLGNSLRALQDEGFLRGSSDGPDPSYRFRHAIIEEAVYQSLTLKSRAHLHRRIANAMEQHLPQFPNAQPEVLARHLEKADDPEAAFPYWQRAARRAYVRSANVEAIAYARRGLSALERSSEPERRGEEELNLLLTLAPALVATRGYGAEEVAPLYLRAKELCSGNEHPQELFRALVGVWNFHWVRGELDLARETAAQLLKHAERYGHSRNAVRAHAATGEILFHMGDVEGSLHNLQAGIRLYETTARHSMSTQIPQVACLCYAAWALWHRGRREEALRQAEQASSLAATLSHPLSVALSSALVSELHQYRIDIAPCIAHARRAIAVSKEQHFPFWEGTGKVMLGWALAMDGDFEQGRHTMLEGNEIFCSTGARIQRPSWLGMLAEIHHRAGRHDKAMSFVEDALNWVKTTGEKHYLSELHRIRGDILYDVGGPAAVGEAMRSYRIAIDVARSQAASMRELRAAVSLARIICEEGLADEARALLETHQAMLDSMSDCVDISNARALRERL